MHKCLSLLAFNLHAVAAGRAGLTSIAGVALVAFVTFVTLFAFFASITFVTLFASITFVALRCGELNPIRRFESRLFGRCKSLFVIGLRNPHRDYRCVVARLSKDIFVCFVCGSLRPCAFVGQTNARVALVAFRASGTCVTGIAFVTFVTLVALGSCITFVALVTLVAFQALFALQTLWSTVAGLALGCLELNPVDIVGVRFGAAVYVVVFSNPHRVDERVVGTARKYVVANFICFCSTPLAAVDKTCAGVALWAARAFGTLQSLRSGLSLFTLRSGLSGVSLVAFVALLTLAAIGCIEGVGYCPNGSEAHIGVFGAACGVNLNAHENAAAPVEVLEHGGVLRSNGHAQNAVGVSWCRHSLAVEVLLAFAVGQGYADAHILVGDKLARLVTHHSLVRETVSLRHSCHGGQRCGD